MIENFSLKKALNELGVSYFGGHYSTKMKLSYENGVETYCLYLAPSDMSGHKVCPNDAYCRQFCLNGSGQNKMDILSRGFEHSKINVSRIKKTKLFFENRELFMRIIIAEINKARIHAAKNGLGFSVRLNGTSDISPEAFKHPNVEGGKNILEIFSDVQFYDYTKVANRLSLINKYKNYDLTFSYTGYNWDDCVKFLENGGKVAVVFDDENGLPNTFQGFDVHDANAYDMRYLDPKGCIMGLTYHRVAANYVDGKYVKPKTRFVVTSEDFNLDA